MTTAQIIDSILQQRGMSRRELAIAANIPPSTFQSAMARGKNITVEMVCAVAAVLGISPYCLMDFDDSSRELSYHINNAQQIIEMLSQLNSAGQAKVIERIEELLELPKYRLEELDHTEAGAE